MPMNYTTLAAPKGTAGSITDWVGYGKIAVQADTILTEVQALIYQALRVREMRFEWVFGIQAGSSAVGLPARFLDPIGRLTDNFGNRYKHRTESAVKDSRMYDNSLSGSFGANPFTTIAPGFGSVNVALANHGLTHLSDITIAGAAAVDGITINGTSLVAALIDANTFAINVLDAAATVGGVTGGGNAATYTANKLIAGQPLQWAIYGGAIVFDGAFDTATQFRLICYKSLPLLSATTPTNFLTDRYPQLLRVATQLWAASFMKDDNEKQKAASDLGALIQATNAESDLMYRGAELDTDTP